MRGNGRILVTGHRGQLGSDLMLYLSDRYSVAGVDLPELDITNRHAVKNLIELVRPSVVVHAAAYTDVDACEAHEGEAMAVNADGTENIAQACRAVGACLVYYSTDYVFDGTKGAAYVEDDLPNPQTVYGKSKLAGEECVIAIVDNYVIMRISWVYGAHGRNFIKTIVRLGAEQLEKTGRGIPAPPLQVVNDQTGNPTWTQEIVKQTDEILSRELYGLFHASAEGETSWFDFTKDIFQELGMRVAVEPCSTEEFPRPAPRPAYSGLENRRLKDARLNVMRHYREALRDFIAANRSELLR